MNQRESTGLPLRAMVMVLLFLGVVFLLVGLQQAIGSGSADNGSQPSSTATATTSATATASSAAAEPAARPEVTVFNVSDVTGAADAAAKTLFEQQWRAKADNLTLTEVPPESTVYFGPTPGEEAAAKEVGAILGFPTAPRLAELAERPPGVIVVVTG